DKTFKRISERLRRENNLCSAVEELENNYHVLNTHFLRFFPLLINHLGPDQSKPLSGGTKKSCSSREIESPDWTGGPEQDQSPRFFPGLAIRADVRPHQSSG
ncbi:MAG TPA: ACP phosphodiesterase, partial [Nitrospirota bacterium]|nr:ACP phosphodiesterase [Nitrospirota bacterium]